MIGLLFNCKKDSLVWKCLFASLLLLSFFRQGICDDQLCCCSSNTIGSPGPSVEFRAGYFFFSDDRMRKIYDGGYDLQFSGSYPVSDCDSWNWLQTYGSVGYQESEGRSIGGHERTTLSKVPVNLGLKSVFEIFPSVQYFLAVGPHFFFLHQHNDSPFVNRNINYDGTGAFVYTGFNYFATCNLYVNIFGEYTYEQMHFHTHRPNVYDRSIQVGGFTFGAGLGYAF